MDGGERFGKEFGAGFCKSEGYTVKKKRRIINPHFAFMTVKSVYEPGVPFHKPFFLEKIGKGL